MKQFLQNLLGIVAILFSMAMSVEVTAQTGVLNPNDTVLTYSSTNNPSQPPAGQIKDWVRTKRVSWNSDSYKCYIYQGMVFRLKFPKSYQHNVADGKTYPLYIFFHGLGEFGPITDNESQLINGGQTHMNAVDQNKFDGFLFYPQNEYGYFGPAQYAIIKDLIEKYFVPQIKVDINRISVDGLSGGGTATWEFAKNQPQLVAAMLPISAANNGNQSTSVLNILKYIPIWHFQGGQDPNPAAPVSRALGQALLNAGANYRYTEYPNRGHSCWNDAWAEADYYPTLNNAHKANPVPLFGKYQFCEGEAVNVTLGISAGFSAYQWRKDGEIITNATSNTLLVTSFGTYEARIRRGTVWSPWSPKPIVVKLKDPTITPPIQPSAGQSSVIPSLTSDKVTLKVPAQYVSYTWQKIGSTTTIGTTDSLVVTSPGQYRVKVTEQYGCVSEFSAPYTVSSSNGPNKPEPATNVVANAVSRTSLKVDWTDNPYPVNNETAFEVYTATKSGGPYFLAAVAPANTNTYTLQNLLVGQKYYVVIRAINATASSATSNEAEGSTEGDLMPPTAPSGLRISNSAGNYATLAWTASTDNVGIYKYDIYVNGKKSYTVNGDLLTFRVHNLKENEGTMFVVKARDSVGNVSAPSNQIFYDGNVLKYRFYTYTGTGSKLTMPDFDTLTPVKTGYYTSLSLTPRTQNDYFAFLYEGLINIPTAGTYVFRTASEDGSKVWMGYYNPTATPIVNNDGDHALTTVEGTPVYLEAGLQPITIGYFHNTGSESLTLSWKVPGSTSFANVPTTAFRLNDYGAAPAAPKNLNAAATGYNKITLNWEDLSSNETGFEISRSSTSATAGFNIIGFTAPNATSYIDSIGVESGVTYYYMIRANSAYGQSAQINNFVEAKWNLNADYLNETPFNRTLTASGNPLFDAADKKEGTHALNFSGASNQYVTINNTDNFLREAYSQRTIALWLKVGNLTGNRIIVDAGGNDDGITLGLQNSQLKVAIASNNVRDSFAIPYTSTDWNHITIVYNQNSLKLYVNAIEVAAKNNLPFTALTTTSNGARLGANNGTNAFNVTAGLTSFIGKMDNVSIWNIAVDANRIADLMNNTLVLSSFTKALELPGIPAVPSTLTSVATGTTSVKLEWVDNSNNETGFEIYRSFNNASNFVLIATVGADVTVYNDQNLYANATYYYKVKAVNITGKSDFGNETHIATLNNLPIFKSVAKQYMRFGSELTINVEATDLDNGVLTLVPQNLPAFATFTSTGNGTASIKFTPANGTLETFAGITVVATDEHGATGSVSFDLEVNDNHYPVIAAVNATTLKEKETAQIVINAADQNPGDVLSWSFVGMPSFATPVVNGASVQVNLAPGFADHGTYVVKALVADGHNGFDSTTFTINVTNVNPNTKIYINFSDGSYAPGSPWNSTNRQPGLNNVHANMVDVNGTVTGVGFKIMTPWQNIGNGSNVLGANTGNNSGVYPDNVIRTAYWTDATNAQTIRFYGLKPGAKYNFTFFGSRGSVSDNRTSNYTINGNTVSLNAAANTQNTVTMYDVVALADSSLSLTLAKGTGSSYAYLNALIIESLSDDGTTPATPRNVAANLVDGIGNVAWLDAAYNETSYEVYRSEDRNGSYTLLNAGALNQNAELYKDSTIAGGKTYFYTVRALNAIGASNYSDTVSLTTPNVAPILSGLDNIRMKTMQVVTMNFNVHDPGDVVTLSATGLPSFATLTNNNNGTATLQVAPGNSLGDYPNVSIIATDSKGASSVVPLSIVVTHKDINAIYVNFNQHLWPVGAPWNNFNSAAFAGKTISNLKNDEQAVTPVSVTLVDAWEGDNDLGSITGNNTGIFPDNVMKTAYYESSSNVKRIRISGLSTASDIKYNLVFFASRAAGDVRNTVYSANGNSVTLNVSNNTTTTVQINGLSANSEGVIEFTAQKGAGSPYAYIGAVVIQSYIDDGKPIAPANLVAAAKSKTSIKLNWQDKSGNEEGFEVYRSLDAAGPFTLLTTTAPNVNTYEDQNLNNNVVYYYKVRSVKAPAFSEFTNVTGVSTYNLSLFINFNRSNNAAAPWVNLASTPEEGKVFVNLKNDLGNSSGIDLTVTKNFSGDNPSGMITGNNSGVVPDNVMRSSWWLDYGIDGELQISGLNNNWAYTFVFFGSRNGGGDRTTVYTINGKSVSLNASYNTTQTVQLENVRPNEDGVVKIGMSLAQYAQFGYINGMMIHGYEVGEGIVEIPSEVPPVMSSVAPPAQSQRIMNTATSLIDVTLEEVDVKEVAMLTEGGGNITKLKAYPNPFVDQITLSAEFAKSEASVNVRLIDISGRIVYTQEFNNVPAGQWNQRLNLANVQTNPGIYILQVVSSGKPLTVKLVRTKY